MWVSDVVNFWFEELPRAAWFEKSVAIDEAIRSRFLAPHSDLVARNGEIDRSNPLALLAAIIVLDQFSRNMFRGTPRAFASDELALHLARDVVDRGFDKAMAKDQRLFAYLPFEHSENAIDQARSVELMAGLADAELTKYAIAHKAIIDRFGRFPHRNAILGRPSTDEEIAFLKEPNSSF
jgi:uncharacterized protein (DUF924 family)